MLAGRNAMRKGGRPVLAILPQALNAWTSDAGPGGSGVYEPPKGWIVPTPTPPVYANAAELQSYADQVGTRIYYISSSAGVDPNHASVMYYFFNGTNIIDNTGSTTGAGGVAYGTDPMNPSGPVVAWAHWSAVGPCNNGRAPGVRPSHGGGAQNPGPLSFAAGTTSRQRKPDWWLFKRGDTFDLEDDRADYATFAPSFGATTLSLSTLGGETWGKRQVIGAYGSLATARPIIGNKAGTDLITRIPGSGANAYWRNVQYMDLHIRTTRPNTTSSLRFNVTNSTSLGTDSYNVFFQGCLFDKMGASNWINTSSLHVTLHRCAQVDTFSNSGHADHQVGCGSSAGNTNSRLQVSECLFARNGNEDGIDPEIAEDAGTLAFDAFTRNHYWGGELNHMQSWIINSISLRGGSGDQFRMGVRLEGNFWLLGAVDNAGHGGYVDGSGPTGSILNNVLQNFFSSGAHTGNGFAVTMGANDTQVVGNIVTNVGGYSVSRGFGMTPIAWGTTSGYDYHYELRRNKVYGNIFESGAAKTIQITDGIATSEGGLAGEPNYSSPGVIDNWIQFNTCVTSAPAPPNSYTQENGGPAALDASNTVANNTIVANRAALGGADSGARSLKTYLQSLGHTVDFGLLDGVQEMIDVWKSDMRRGTWDDRYTALAVNNYIRRGVAMPPLLR